MPAPRLAAALLAAVCLGLATPGCSQLESYTGGTAFDAVANLPTTMQQVSDLTGDIARWSSDLTGFVSDPQLDQLSGFVSRSGDLANALSGAGSVPGVSTIQATLDRLASFGVGELEPLTPEQRVEPVSEFTGIAGNLDQLVTQYLGSR